MNEYQKKKICELRMAGLGYKAIANAVGLSRDIVRNFCKNNRLNGYLAYADDNFRKTALEPRLCLNCQMPIKQNKRGRVKKFCSEFCRRSWWKENPDKKTMKASAMYKTVCPCCGLEFTSYGNKNRKYCSHECYIKDRFGGKDNGV